MENYKSFKLITNEGLDQNDQNILSRYWTFDGTKFQESITEIAKDYDREYTQLLQMVQVSSVAIIQDDCAGCQTELKPLEARSQTKFKKFFKGKNYCPICQKIENERKEKELVDEEKRYYEERDRILENAVFERAWLNLTLQETRFLLHLIESPCQNIENSEYAHLYPHDNSELIDKIMYYGLIYEDSPYDMYDMGYHYSPLLSEQLKVYLNKFKNDPNENSSELNGLGHDFDNHFSANWARVSLELRTSGPFQNSSTPSHSGTFIAEHDILIKAGTKCVYGVWPWKNENMWLSITPVGDIIGNQNKSIQNEPEPIKSILERKLNNY